MTCVIGLKTQNRLYMGSDSAITLGNGIMATASTKVLKTDTCMIGVSGPRVVLNALAEKDYVFAGKFNASHLNKIWECLKQATPINTESEMLIAVNKELFWIGNIAGWRVVVEEFECIGNGSQVAKGAMEMSYSLIDQPEERIFKSLAISEKYCVGVKAPFNIEYIDNEQNN